MDLNPVTLISRALKVGSDAPQCWEGCLCCDTLQGALQGLVVSLCERELLWGRGMEENAHDNTARH